MAMHPTTTPQPRRKSKPAPAERYQRSGTAERKPNEPPPQPRRTSSGRDRPKRS